MSRNEKVGKPVSRMAAFDDTTNASMHRIMIGLPD
jgi:hypothetical protein